MYMLGLGILHGWSETESQVFNNRFSMDENYDSEQYNPDISLPSLMVGAVIGSISIGFITTKFGRKIPLMLISVPMIVNICKISFQFSYLNNCIFCSIHFIQIGCLINLVVHKFVFYQVSMLLMGLFFGGVCVVAPLFVLEISNNR